PESNDALAGLVDLYSRAKQFDKAIQRINAIPEAKRTAFHYGLLGAVLSKAGKGSEAELAYKKVLEKDPSNISGYASLAPHYIDADKIDDGLAGLDSLIKVAPSKAGAYEGKGVIYETQGKVKEAKAAYEAALKVNPNLPVSSNNLAYIISEEGGDL